MIYPKFLKNGSIIGIPAPSGGLGGDEEELEIAIKRLNQEGFKVVETKSVRNMGVVSNDILNRAKEFNELDNVDMMVIARGGDYLYEILPYLDLEKIKKNPQWVMGYSDPTSILVSLTTKYDIATMYGYNISSYGRKHLCVEESINIIKGLINKQGGYDKVIHTDGTEDKVYWNSNKDSFKVSGRIIGGCVEVLKDLAGTSFVDFASFNQKYCNEGIIWYFDIYGMSSTDFYLTLLQFKNLNYFQNVKAILVSRMHEKKEADFTYEEAIEKVFKDIPYITDMDIGHTFPKMTIINGAIAKINYKNHNGLIDFELK